MTGLVEWLLAQYDADETVARAAITGPWAVADNGEVYAPGFDREVRSGLSYPSRPATGTVEHLYVTCDGEGLSPSVQPDEAAHIARFNPAAVLADLAAKRRIVELHEHVGSWQAWEWDEGDPLPIESGEFGCRICALDDRQIEPKGWCQTLRLLALPYAGRDGYDPAWAPD